MYDFYAFKFDRKDYAWHVLTWDRFLFRHIWGGDFSCYIFVMKLSGCFWMNPKPVKPSVQIGTKLVSTTSPNSKSSTLPLQVARMHGKWGRSGFHGCGHMVYSSDLYRRSSISRTCLFPTLGGSGIHSLVVVITDSLSFRTVASRAARYVSVSAVWRE